jgi:hypothetical protein
VAIAVQHDQVALFQIDPRQRIGILQPPHRHGLGIARTKLAPFHQWLLIGIARKDGHAGFSQAQCPVSIDVVFLRHGASSHKESAGVADTAPGVVGDQRSGESGKSAGFSESSEGLFFFGNADVLSALAG